MQGLRYTLVADGPSDRSLISILTWLLRQFCGLLPIQGGFADLRRLRPPPTDLADRLHRAVELYPCDLLFVHRDAEKATVDQRLAEIAKSVMGCQLGSLPVVCVVPVRMTEAWLLIDEAALRGAAGNPNGTQPLAMPSPRTLEQIPSPKILLHDLLSQASGLEGRRLRKFNSRRHEWRVAELISDFRPLYQLVAFRRLAVAVEQVVATEGLTYLS